MSSYSPPRSPPLRLKDRVAKSEAYKRMRLDNVVSQTAARTAEHELRHRHMGLGDEQRATMTRLHAAEHKAFLNHRYSTTERKIKRAKKIEEIAKASRREPRVDPEFEGLLDAEEDQEWLEAPPPPPTVRPSRMKREND
jgi:hypothetical protein